MRVATWNIHGWKTADNKPNLIAVGDTLAAIQPDIVGLNEVFYPRIAEGSSKPALEALAERLGMNFIFGPCLRWQVQDDMPADAYGNAILSRWPIIASSAHHLTPKEEDKEDRLAGKEQRGLLEGRILLPNQQTFTLYVTHLDHTDEEARLVQLRVARTWLQRDRNRPHLLMGDFNSLSLWDIGGELADLRNTLLDEEYRHMLGSEKGPQVVSQVEKSGYTDTYSHFGKPKQTTFPNPLLPIRIDYIFASQSLAPRINDCRICDNTGQVSDHFPVVAEIGD